MPRNNSKEERLTEDEIARRKLGPRGVPGGEDSAKMTSQQQKNIPKEGEFANGASRRAVFGGPRRAGGYVSSWRFSKSHPWGPGSQVGRCSLGILSQVWSIMRKPD